MKTVFTLVTTFLLIVGGATVYGQQYFGLEDLHKLHSLSDPQVSPDGKSVLIVVSKPDTASNTNKASLFKINVATGEKQQLTFGRDKVRSPRWSPSGNALAFLSADESKKPQIHVLSMNGGEAKKITASPMGVQQFSWRPDGKQFAFVQTDEILNKEEMKKGYDAFEVGNHSMFVQAKPSPNHLWLIPTEGGKATRLTSGKWSISPAPISWSPDGKQIAFQKGRSPYFGDILFTAEIVEVASGKISRITKAQFEENDMHKEGQPIFSPDGKSIAYQFQLENVGYGSDVYFTPTSGGKEINLTAPIDRCFFKVQWSADSKAVIVAANDINKTSMWLQPLKGKAKKLNLSNLTLAGGYYGIEYSVGKSNAIAFVGSSSQLPPELYILETPESSPKKLTSFNAEIAALSLGKQETISWKSDEFTPNGILTFPPNFNPAQKYPVIVNPHGGPRSASKESFRATVQLMAAKGYIVFRPNYRGSDNMGYQFSEAISGDMGEGPGRDVMSGLAELKKRTYVDSTKIAVSGWSYGGFMTTWLIGNYEGWQCAVAGAAVTDWITQYTQNDVGSIYRFEFGKGTSPFTDAKVKANWVKNSPITYVQNVKTPTLILSNTGDERVPISQSYMYYKALQDNGVESKFVAFPIPGHSPTDPARKKEVNRLILDWLDKYLN